MEPQKAREAARIPWQACLPESVRGEACACKNSREGGVQTSVVLASTVLLGCQKLKSCTLGQLMSPRSESVFFASFLCRFGQRNDVPPRTVANSDKENSQNKQTTKAESSNPAKNPTATARTQHPAPKPECERKPLRLLHQPAATSTTQSAARFLRASFADPQSCQSRPSGSKIPNAETLPAASRAPFARSHAVPQNQSTPSVQQSLHRPETQNWRTRRPWLDR